MVSLSSWTLYLTITDQAPLFIDENYNVLLSWEVVSLDHCEFQSIMFLISNITFEEIIIFLCSMN